MRADPVADLVVGDTGPDGGHHPGEIHAETLALPVHGEVLTEGEQHSAKLILEALTATSICPGWWRLRSAVTNSRVSRSPGVRMSRRIPSCSVSTVVVRRSSGRSGLCPSRAAYHEPCRHAVSSSSDPLSNSLATLSPSVCASTSIWVGRSGGCSAPMTRNRPRHAALVEIDRVAQRHRLCAAGDDIQPRRFALGVRQFPRDADEATRR